MPTPIHSFHNKINNYSLNPIKKPSQIQNPTWKFAALGDCGDLLWRQRSGFPSYRRERPWLVGVNGSCEGRMCLELIEEEGEGEKELVFTVIGKFTVLLLLIIVAISPAQFLSLPDFSLRCVWYIFMLFCLFFFK